MCSKRACLSCSQGKVRPQGSQLWQLFMESLRKVEVNRQHLNPCGRKGCLSFPRNTLFSPDRCEAASRNGALANPFLWELGRYGRIGLQTWSQVKEFFFGSECSSPVGLDQSCLAVCSAASVERSGSSERRLAFCVKLTVL